MADRHWRVGRADARNFSILGAMWVRLVEGIVVYVGIGHVLVFYGAFWGGD